MRLPRSGRRPPSAAVDNLWRLEFNWIGIGTGIVQNGRCVSVQSTLTRCPFHSLPTQIPYQLNSDCQHLREGGQRPPSALPCQPSNFEFICRPSRMEDAREWQEVSIKDANFRAISTKFVQDPIPIELKISRPRGSGQRPPLAAPSHCYYLEFDCRPTWYERRLELTNYWSKINNCHQFLASPCRIPLLSSLNSPNSKEARFARFLTHLRSLSSGQGRQRRNFL